MDRVPAVPHFAKAIGGVEKDAKAQPREEKNEHLQAENEERGLAIGTVPAPAELCVLGAFSGCIDTPLE